MLKKWHCPHLLWLAVLRPPCCCGAGRAAIDRYLLPAVPTAANPPHAAAAGEWDRQTDGHAYNTGSANSDVDTYHHHHQHRVKYSFIYKLSSTTQTKHKYNMQKK